MYLRAVLAHKRGKPVEDVVALLNDASTTHFSALKGIPLGIDYYTQMNPDFVLELVKEYLAFGPSEVSVSCTNPPKKLWYISFQIVYKSC